jgi:hypothetical protein
LHLNLAYNNIGVTGALIIADALRQMSGCPNVLQSIDLHGNGIGDNGCVALSGVGGWSFATALSALSECQSHRRSRLCGYHGASVWILLLPDVDVSQPESAYVDNGVAGVQAGAGPGAATTATVQAIVTLPSLTTTLDLSWNCIGIANLEALAEALAVRSSLTNSSSLRPSLTELDLKGNLLSDAGCARLCAALRASGATPLLILDTESESDAGGVQA